MARPLATTALVLKVVGSGEADRFVTLLSADLGKVRALAKYVRRPRSRRQAALLPGSLIKCGLIRQGERTILTEALLESAGMPVQTPSLERLRDILAVLEIVDGISAEGEASPALFEQALALLIYLKAEPEPHRGWIRQQLRAMLAEQGLVAEDADQQSVSALVESFLDRPVRSFSFLRV